MIRPKSISLYGLILISVFLTGCAFSPNDEFTAFSPESFGEQQVLIIVDTLKLDDVEGDTHLLNLDVNHAVADSLFEAAGREMVNRGYTVAPGSVRSAGLMVNSATQFLVLERGSEEDGKTDWNDNLVGQLESAPYFVDFGPLSENALLSLNQVHQNVVSTELKRFNDVGPLGLERLDLDDYSGVLVMQGYGVDIPFGKSMAQGLATAILTLGMFTASQQSATNYSATLMNPQTGEVVWANHLNLTGVMRRPEQINNMVETLLRDLPERLIAGQGETDTTNASMN